MSYSETSEIHNIHGIVNKFMDDYLHVSDEYEKFLTEIEYLVGTCYDIFDKLYNFDYFYNSRVAFARNQLYTNRFSVEPEKIEEIKTWFQDNNYKTYINDILDLLRSTHIKFTKIKYHYEIVLIISLLNKINELYNETVLIKNIQKYFYEQLDKIQSNKDIDIKQLSKDIDLLISIFWTKDKKRYFNFIQKLRLYFSEVLNLDLSYSYNFNYTSFHVNIIASNVVETNEEVLHGILNDMREKIQPLLDITKNISYRSSYDISKLREIFNKRNKLVDEAIDITKNIRNDICILDLYRSEHNLSVPSDINIIDDKKIYDVKYDYLYNVGDYFKLITLAPMIDLYKKYLNVKPDRESGMILSSSISGAKAHYVNYLYTKLNTPKYYDIYNVDQLLFKLDRFIGLQLTYGSYHSLSTKITDDLIYNRTSIEILVQENNKSFNPSKWVVSGDIESIDLDTDFEILGKYSQKIINTFYGGPKSDTDLRLIYLF
jgi:hypothetical protein